MIRDCLVYGKFHYPPTRSPSLYISILQKARFSRKRAHQSPITTYYITPLLYSPPQSLSSAPRNSSAGDAYAGVEIYGGQSFPAEYGGNAFVTIFGSWLKPNVQTGIQRVEFIPDGNSYDGETSWFVLFPEGVMPLPLVFGPDGALYVGDYVNDAIYRISYGLPG